MLSWSHLTTLGTSTASGRDGHIYAESFINVVESSNGQPTTEGAKDVGDRFGANKTSV